MAWLSLQRYLAHQDWAFDRAIAMLARLGFRWAAALFFRSGNTLPGGAGSVVGLVFVVL